MQDKVAISSYGDPWDSILRQCSLFPVYPHSFTLTQNGNLPWTIAQKPSSNLLWPDFYLTPNFHLAGIDGEIIKKSYLARSSVESNIFKHFYLYCVGHTNSSPKILSFNRFIPGNYHPLIWCLNTKSVFRKIKAHTSIELELYKASFIDKAITAVEKIDKEIIPWARKINEKKIALKGNNLSLLWKGFTKRYQ